VVRAATADLFRQMFLAAQRDLRDLQVLRCPFIQIGECRFLILRGLLRCSLRHLLRLIRLIEGCGLARSRQLVRA
jgi:hypothetical protein